jgi:hypothetical protein
LYYHPGTNKTTKEAKAIFKSNFEIFSSQKIFTELDHQERLKLSRDYFNDLINNSVTDVDFLKSMKRSFAARIGRQKRLENLVYSA